MFEWTPCVYANALCVHAPKCTHICVCTCRYMCTGINAYIYRHWVCIPKYVCIPKSGCIQMQCVCMQIYVYISGFVRVCVYVYNYTCMYEETPCVDAECVHTNTGIHVCVCILFTGCFLVYIYMPVCQIHTCVCIYLHISTRACK